MKKVNSIQKLKELASGEADGLDCAVVLGGGGIKSSKQIWYFPESQTFHVFNLIDDSEQELSEAELYTHSNIGEAITKGALIY